MGISLKLHCGIPVSGHGMSCLGAGSGCRSGNWTHPSPGQAQGWVQAKPPHKGPLWPLSLNLGSASPSGPGKCFPPGSSRSCLSWPRHWPHTQASLSQRYPDASCSEPLDLAPISQPGVLEAQGLGNGCEQYPCTRIQHFGQFFSSQCLLEAVGFTHRGKVAIPTYS